MKSEICRITKESNGREEALKETEKVAAYCGLNRKQTLQLRLLAEELTGMMQGIAYSCSANFRIEAESGEFKLYLTSDEILDRETRKQLIAASSSRKNEATRGIMGKVRAAFEYCLTTESGEPISVPVAEGLNVGVNESGATVVWSMEKYRSQAMLERRSHREEWDELEKSIVANIADNITVGTTNQYAEIVVTKRFKKAET